MLDARQLSQKLNRIVPSALLGVGIDGCRGGWIVCNFLASGLQWQFIESLEVGKVLIGSGIILIDIPIGLPDLKYPNRRCDQEARQLLGVSRRSSVFSPPSRTAIEADNYAEALRLNRDEVGKGFSIQAWNLAPKIRETAAYLKTKSAGDLRESHPEVCWNVLSGRTDLSSKKTNSGREERSTILQKYDPLVHGNLQTSRVGIRARDAQIDDFLDAAILAIAAAGKLRPVPEIPEEGEAIIWVPVT